MMGKPFKFHSRHLSDARACLETQIICHGTQLSIPTIVKALLESEGTKVIHVVCILCAVMTALNNVLFHVNKVLLLYFLYRVVSVHLSLAISLNSSLS